MENPPGISKWLKLDARAFSVLLVLLFILRGIQMQCLYPPLEGCDEYQHIAYLVFLNKHHHPPVYGQDVVPPSLYPELVANPHCNFDWQQTRRIGTRTYEDFYDHPAVQTGNAPIRLYEAQQPPLYYELVAPVFGWWRQAFGFRAAVYFIRLLNILFGGVAMLLLLTPLRAVFKEESLGRIVALAISLSPAFLVCVARVANDPLAMLFGGVAVWLLTRWQTSQSHIVNAALIGGMLGLGTLTKLTTLSLLPGALLFPLFLACCSKVNWRVAGLSVAIILGTYLMIVLPHVFESIQKFGTPFLAQETVINSRNGASLFDLLRAIRPEQIFFLIGRLLKGSLWQDGWSFLSAKTIFINIYLGILIIAFGGLVAGMIRWTKLASFSAIPLEAIALPVLIIIFTLAAVYAYALNCVLAYGVFAVLPNYAAVGYPAFLICVFAAARSYGRSAVVALAAALALLFLATEYYSLLWIGAPFWAHTHDYAEMFRRLGTIHPTLLSPWCFFPSAVAVISLTVLLAWSNWRMYCRETTAPGKFD